MKPEASLSVSEELATDPILSHMYLVHTLHLNFKTNFNIILQSYYAFRAVTFFRASNQNPACIYLISYVCLMIRSPYLNFIVMG
jgi:hypothetical protein